ncbi:Muscle-specific protein 20-like isoform X1 [Oopsacas minuta]|uniref:Muscle-specific protein 20-like isoform X1 n=1 Tax=Oopsacas minuta TaxID=111878 RepID=A0AAV7JVX8_9METZ|nr:Muscle-specific protein 20-like isoform X1 [Oopsacas minuta]
MAYRAPKSGIAADIQRKRQSEYKVSIEREAIEWIECVIWEQKNYSVNFHEWLLDGSILCKLFNYIEPNQIPSKHFKPTSATFKQLDNINMFIMACKNYGIKEGDLFVSLDLHEANDLAQVLSSIFSLERMAHKNGWIGPRLEAKEYEKYVKKITKSRLEEGKRIIPMQTDKRFASPELLLFGSINQFI